MILFKEARALRQHLANATLSGLKTGFVPTMGALHEGHISLVGLSKQQADLTVCSIFVNPTQFNDPADFAKYPVTIEQDILLLEQAGCDILFLPPADEIYPEGSPADTYALGKLETLLEGKYRPGHFQGVCQVMKRLLSVVLPDKLFMGQKDYQQCMVIKQLLHITGLPAALIISPTQREASGLAMSSRNVRLSARGKEKAAAIFQSLQWIRHNLHKGTTGALTRQAADMLTAAGFDKIDYISIADAGSLEPVETWDGETKLVVLAAAFLEKVRLIDNLALN